MFLSESRCLVFKTHKMEMINKNTIKKTFNEELHLEPLPSVNYISVHYQNFKTDLCTRLRCSHEREGGGIQLMNVTNETVNDLKLKLLLIICLSLALSSEAHPFYILNKSQSRSRCDKESWANHALKNQN